MKRHEIRFLHITVLLTVLFFQTYVGAQVPDAGAPQASRTQKAKAAQGTPVEELKPAGPALSLGDYLNQVARQNDAFRGAELAVKAAELRSDEWSLLTTPSLFANASFTDDRREALSAFSPTQTKTHSYSLGLSQQTRYGLSGRVFYNYVFTDATYQAGGAIPANFLPPSSFYTTGPVLELSQSFGRNGFGGETQATEELLRAQVLATKYAESFRKSTLRADAESAFWRLALAREAVDLSKDNLERARRIQQLNFRRAQQQLSDRADVLQADAAMFGRELELQAALDEEKAASRAFNTFRGVSSDAVGEALPVLDQDLMSGLRVPKRTDQRVDVKAAAARQQIAQANARLGAEKNKPTIDVFANMGLNGRDPAVSPAVSESFTTDHPNYTIGARINVPLDFETLDRNRQGYAEEKLAADANLKRWVFENERLWNDLNKRFIESQQRFRLARRIELAQREKLEYERDRQRRGRSTTFQVIQFEGDFALSQLNRIRIQADVLNIFAQLKTFGGGQ